MSLQTSAFSTFLKADGSSTVPRPSRLRDTKNATAFTTPILLCPNTMSRRRVQSEIAVVTSLAEALDELKKLSINEQEPYGGGMRIVKKHYEHRAGEMTSRRDDQQVFGYSSESERQKEETTELRQQGGILPNSDLRTITDRSRDTSTSTRTSDKEHAVCYCNNCGKRNNRNVTSCTHRRVASADFSSDSSLFPPFPDLPVHRQSRHLLQYSSLQRRRNNRPDDVVKDETEIWGRDGKKEKSDATVSQNRLDDLGLKLERLMESVDRQNRRIESIHQMVGEDILKNRDRRSDEYVRGGGSKSSSEETEESTYRSLDILMAEDEPMETTMEIVTDTKPKAKRWKRNVLLSCIR